MGKPRRPVNRSKLTPKQEAFCLAYTKTGIANEAYRQVYDASEMSAAAIEVEASGELRRFYVKHVESINEFADWSDEELEAFIRDENPAAVPDGKARSRH